MRTLKSKIVAMASVMALTALMSAPAGAANDRLTVKNTSDAVVFKVDDTGLITGSKAGLGTTTPQAPFHLHLPTALGATTSPGTALYNVSTGFAGSTQDNTFQVDVTVADGTSTAGYRGAIRGVRSRGSLTSPAIPAVDDQVLSLLGAVYTGRTVWNVADISYKVDGTVSDGGTNPSIIAPVRITFNTRPAGSTWYERMTIKSNGNVGINAPSPTSKLQVVGLPVYSSNATAIAGGLTAGAFYTDGVGNVKVVY